MTGLDSVAHYSLCMSQGAAWLASARFEWVAHGVKIQQVLPLELQLCRLAALAPDPGTLLLSLRVGGRICEPA